MSDRDFWNFYSAGRIVFGSGVIRRLDQFLKPWKSEKVLIITDPILVKAGIVAQVEAPLRNAGLTVEVFDGGEPEPSFAVADQGIEFSANFRPDVIVGVGGGSNLDLAKIVACGGADRHSGPDQNQFAEPFSPACARSDRPKTDVDLPTTRLGRQRD